MKFNPEEAENQLLAEGEADFKVLIAEDATSKSGNEMIKLMIKVWDREGREGTVFDYLLPKLAWKIKQFCQATGIPLEKFKSGELCAADCADKTGKANIKTQKDKTGQYEDKSSIAGYVALEAGASASTAKGADGDPGFSDDDIPF